MYYRDIDTNQKPQTAEIRLPFGEAEALVGLLDRRQDSYGIVRYISDWLVQHPDMDTELIIKGEAARQSRRVIGEAALTGVLVSANGYRISVPEELRAQAMAMTLGGDALDLNQAPVDLAAFTEEFEARATMPVQSVQNPLDSPQPRHRE